MIGMDLIRWLDIGGAVANDQNHNMIAIRHAQKPPLLITMALCIVTVIQMAVADVDSDDAYQLERQPHRGLFADTKYWSRVMEFGDQDNWHNNLKPCTMLERIAIDGDDIGGLVVSLGDNSIGSLESVSIRQLVLANDGVLLLQNDTADSETAFMNHLAAHSLDCFDSASLPEQLQDWYWFNFGPHSDQLSWFNPANWKSGLAEDLAGLMPESHLVPCSQDVVVFGLDHWNSIKASSESSQSSPLSPFKVNFRPSELMLTSQQANLRPINSMLRVSKLKIGNKSYTQDEFNQLVGIYGDNLFDFNDPKSILDRGVSDSLFDENRGSHLIIDETSLSAEQSDGERCFEVAGCLCANEEPPMMKIICSFHQPLGADDLPCHDPIRSFGYCDPICATSIIINMSPLEFSERFVTSTINKLMEQGPGGGTIEGESSQEDPDYFGESIFTGSRRIDQGRYEITLRIYPLHNEHYENILGRERELAQLIRQHLDKPAIRSFYGIKSVNIRSSVRWRHNSQSSIFWIIFIVTLVILMLELGLHEGRLMDNVLHQTNITTIIDWLALIGEPQRSTGLDSNKIVCGTIAGTRSMGFDRVDDDLEHELDESGQGSAMIELDSRSVTDSTLNLLID